MAVTEVCYCTREEIKRALDVKETARATLQIDRANETAARDIDGSMKRRFYCEDDTRLFDWPNYQYANPWRLWLYDNELAVWPAVAILAGTQAIPLNTVFPGPWMEHPGPPWTFIELDRSSTSAFGGNSPTPQRSISIQGTFGYDTLRDQMATLSTAITTTTQTPIVISDSSRIGPGIVIWIDAERMLVQDSAMSATGATLVTGATTSQVTDNTLSVTGGTLNLFEVIAIDSERMLVVDQTLASNYVVKRGYDGTQVATHGSGTAIAAPRTLTVGRGGFGTTAATHLISAPVSRARVPSSIRDLAIGLAEGQLTGEASAYAGAPSSGGSQKIEPPLMGIHLQWHKAMQRYRRNIRMRAI